MAKRLNQRRRQTQAMLREQHQRKRLTLLLQYFVKQLQTCVNTTPKDIKHRQQLKKKKNILITKIVAHGTEANRPEVHNKDIETYIKDLINYKRGINGRIDKTISFDIPSFEKMIRALKIPNMK